MPVINRAAIDMCVKTGLALNCVIPDFSKMDRKNYGYPDLPKGYQISQYDLPLCVGGALTFESGGADVTAGVTRVHIEEDTGRLVHAKSEEGDEISLVDLNRSGVPLMEIVGDPDLRTRVNIPRSDIPADGVTGDLALDRRLNRKHGRGRLPLRRQCVGARSRWLIRRPQGRDQKHE